MRAIRCLFLISTFLIALPACAASAPEVLVTSDISALPATIPPTAVNLPTALEPTPSPQAVLAASPFPVPTASKTPQACSPLPGYDLDALQAAVANPFHPPRPGSDDPHQGIDYADLEPTLGYAQDGHLVAALLPGVVAAIITNRFPYGNAVLVETLTDLLPPAVFESIALPTPAPTLNTAPALTCPQTTPHAWSPEPRSLYLMYAHLLSPPPLELDQPVICGQAIGQIGASGNALNPHLHVEARLGPSGARFQSMAHYDPGASSAEMDAYCTWRVSGWFQLIDPAVVVNSIQ